METPDAYTIKFKLDQPLGDFPTNVSSWSFLWVKELIEDDDRLQEQAIGTGAFVQDEWSKKERSVFDKHPEYFEEGLPYLDGIITNIQNDSAARRAGFMTDAYMDWGARDDDDLESMANQVDDMIGWRLPISRGANVNGWHFQMNNPVFQDVRVRRAISLAFDRDEHDLADNAGDNQAPGGAFSNPPMPWAFLFDEYPDASANGEFYRFDPARARQLMQAAGYTADDPLKFEHVTWYDRTDSAEIIIPGVTEVLPEVDISFRQVDNPTQVTALSDRNFDETMGIAPENVVFEVMDHSPIPEGSAHQAEKDRLSSHAPFVRLPVGVQVGDFVDPQYARANADHGDGQQRDDQDLAAGSESCG